MLNFVGQTQFIFMMFNGLKSYKKKLILVIYASGSVHENFGVCNKLAYNRNSHVGWVSNLINSKFNLFMYLIWMD